MLYPRVYFYLRAQKTVLLSLESAITEGIDNEEGESRCAMTTFLSIVETLLVADYARIFQCADTAIPQIEKWLTKHVSPQAEKHGYALLSSSLAIARLLTMIMYDSVAVEDGNNMALVGSPTRMDSPTKSASDPVIGDEDGCVVCRICEKRVALGVIEAHSKNCVLAYQSSKTMISIDERMAKLQAHARQTILRTAWPGTENGTVSVTLPVVHAVTLLDRAISTDPRKEGADAELVMVGDSLMVISQLMLDTEAANTIKKASVFVSEKVNATLKLAHAISIIHRTSLSDSQFTVTQTPIADFQFIKRISRGAYARVFLGRKNKTGDVYAIKVLPKSGLRQKNEVQRVLIEKDILLKVSSPYMIKFCTFFSGCFVAALLVTNTQSIR